MKPLQERCSFTIISALRQRGGVEVTQLMDRLPHYVPTSTKRSICDAYKDIEYQYTLPTTTRTPVFKYNLDSPIAADDIVTWPSPLFLNCTKLAEVIGVKLDSKPCLLDSDDLERHFKMVAIILRWESGEHKPQYPPTWRSLCEVLEVVGQQEQREEVEKFIRCMYYRCDQ